MFERGDPVRISKRENDSLAYYTRFIGSILVTPKVGGHMMVAAPDEGRVFQTSEVEQVETVSHFCVRIVTRNSIYIVSKIENPDRYKESGESEWRC